MTLLPPPPPPARRATYAYAIVDIRQNPPEVKQIEMTRRAARDKIQWDKDADSLRIRRCRVSLYES